MPSAAYSGAVAATPFVAATFASTSCARGPPELEATPRSKGLASSTAVVSVSRREEAPTIMVTTRATPMTMALPVAEVRPGLRIVFSRAMRASMPGHAAPSRRVRGGRTTENARIRPKKASRDRPNMARKRVVVSAVPEAAQTPARAPTAISAPMTRRAVWDLRAPAPASLTGASAAIGGTREADSAGKRPTAAVNTVAAAHTRVSWM